MKKFVLQLDLEDAADKRRALKTVSTLSGIDEITIDVKAKKLTVIGTVDPVSVVSKLRKKNWPTHIISVGPAKEPEPKKEEPKKEEAKKEEPKKEAAAKEEPKKEEPKKEEGKKEEPKKEEEKKAPEVPPQMVLANAMPYRPYYLPPQQRPYYPPPPSYYYAHQSMEENPNACVIC